MNGISLLVPENVARIGFGILLLFNGFVFWKAFYLNTEKHFPEKRSARYNES